MVGKATLAKLLHTTFKVVLLLFHLMVERQTLFLLVRQVSVLVLLMLLVFMAKLVSLFR